MWGFCSLIINNDVIFCDTHSIDSVVTSHIPNNNCLLNIIIVFGFVLISTCTSFYLSYIILNRVKLISFQCNCVINCIRQMSPINNNLSYKLMFFFLFWNFWCFTLTHYSIFAFGKPYELNRYYNKNGKIIIDSSVNCFIKVCI